ncbi:MULTISPECIES: ERF family protein [unclassified Oceanobacillus]|uniref:ERF family protein n=1 Tax=unclassified Oceanobacillus TaxID=2630292 RepID=UPI001BEB46F6|nr:MULTISPECIES: ERF family protein [unclassified Oceanobacillus]MBT2601257.1 ERF family protein [Oceanobacillus sp. ISL-74]MBT2653637.1 ERF family protein [Oceanobacillus sp. ISL-73]
MSDRQLVKKLAKVMTEVKHIEKKGYNKFHKYHYATESDVAERVREVLAEQSVMMLPDIVEHSTREHTNQKGNTEYIATVKVKFTFIDGETGEELSIHSVGEGQDAGDKAVYKAITGAQKYALMKAFMIPTGDDPEADTNTSNNNQPKQQAPSNNQQVASDKQLNFIKKLIKDNVSEKYDEQQLHQLLKERIKTNNNLENFTPQEASAAIKFLNKSA